MSHSRDETLALLHGNRLERLPVFSGLPSLTASGLRAAGVRYAEAHLGVTQMVAAAASTFEICGFESAVVPFDMCVEAEALGAHADFQTEFDLFMPPIIDVPVYESPWRMPEDVSRAGRIPLVGEALQRLRRGVGREIAIGAWIPGPFTLAWQLFGADTLFSMLHDPERMAEQLSRLGNFLGRTGAYYRSAGADFLTVHEMGGSPQAVGPVHFSTLIKPALVRLIAQLPAPKVLSVCGNTNDNIADLAACGADALNVDQRNDLARTRQLLPRAILLGNLDPVGTLSQGTPESVIAAVRRAADSGVDAIWPGCDLTPEIPDANLRALMDAGRRHPRPFSNPP